MHLKGLSKAILKRVRRSFGGLLVGAACAASSLTTTWAAGDAPIETLKPGILQVCLNASFPPFGYKENDAWKGWDMDYLTAFARANGLAVEVVEIPEFEGVWLMPGEGKCDIAGSGISDTPERRAEVAAAGRWSRSYYGVLRSFLVRSTEHARLAKVEDLRGKTAIVTKGSTALSDLCYRIQLAEMHVCARSDGDRPCADLDAVPRTADASCVGIEYPRDNSEANAVADVVDGAKPDGPFAFGAGYQTNQLLARQSSGLTLVWPHCNMTTYEGRIEAYAEPLSFVVASRDSGLLRALNEFIESNKTPYPGPNIPNLACKAPPWTLEASGER